MKIKKIKLLAALLFGFFLSGCSWQKPRNAGLQVITSEPSAIYLDDNYLDKTPLINRQLKPGQYRLRIQPIEDQLPSYDTTIQLNAGLLTVVEWRAHPQPEFSSGIIYEMKKIDRRQTGRLSVISLPENAHFTLNQQAPQTTPAIIDDLAPGEYRFQIEMEGYQSQENRLKIIAGYQMDITVKLAKKLPAEPIKATNQNNTVETSRGPTSSPAASQSAQQVKILSTNFFIDNREVLKVRQASSSASPTIGFAPVGASYPYLNQTFNGWRKILFENKIGWVSGQYSRLIDGDRSIGSHE